MKRNIVTSFSYKEEKESMVEEFDRIARREGKGKSELLVQLIEEYVKVHSSGNPTFTLEQFQDPEFQAVPAYYSDQQKWVNHYKNSNDRDRTNLRVKAMNIQKWFRMVDTNP